MTRDRILCPIYLGKMVGISFVAIALF